eukprot:CAMPEP_0119302976 /NCGR_PEP_ID=MMETSP1333-20130426/4493_1 /TAXON_ID=418940 /ORGANISM="Scyphosphaera apsteinii, Strain RCC1455" /LENGTH=140 /DNA_ID=CAMNT_0007305519 /DNA_START=67 /DNA_END=489 /DNA_ORIENTATION=-
MTDQTEENTEEPMEATVDSQGRPFISMADVAKHAAKDDMWLVIHDKVYKISEYLDEHPGGEEVLMDRAGQNATVDFEDVGHSNDARKQLAKFQVGELPPSERSATKNGETSSQGGSFNMVFAGLVVAAAVGYYYYSTLQG